MTTREQDTTIERLAEAHGRVHIKEGFEDGAIHTTVPNGQCFTIDRWGDIHNEDLNRSVDWWSDAPRPRLLVKNGVLQ